MDDIGGIILAFLFVGAIALVIIGMIAGFIDVQDGLNTIGDVFEAMF